MTTSHRMDQAYIDMLPEEVWCEIFTFIGDVADIIRIQIVSRSWRDRTWSSITWLNFASIRHNLNETILLNILERTPALKKLDLTGLATLSEKCLQALQMASNLTSLTLASCENVVWEHLAHISALSQLKELDCNGIFGSSDRFAAEPFLFKQLKPQQITLKHIKTGNMLIHRLETLASFSNLTALDLRGSSLLNENTTPYLPLKELTNLRTLDLSDMSARLLSNKELLELSVNLTNLRRLGLAQRSKLSGKGFANMSCLQQLHWLNIMGIQQLDINELLRHLRHNTNLKTLLIDCEPNEVNSIKASFIQDIDIITTASNNHKEYYASQVSHEWCRNVWLGQSSLYLTSKQKIGFTDPLPHFRKLFARLNPARLRLFSIDLQNFNNRIWEYITRLINLEVLQITQCDLITDYQALTCFSRLTRLIIEILDLTSINLGEDCDPSIICKCTTLKELKLDLMSNVTGAVTGFEHVSNLTGMHDLTLARMPMTGVHSSYEPLTVLTALTAFSFHPQLTDSDFRIVTHFAHLTYLHTNKVPLYGAEFEQVLPHMTRLQELHIDHARLTTQQFAQVSLLLDLHTLSYNFSNTVELEDLSALETCTKLTRLDVNDFNREPTGLFATMKKLPSLAVVSLEGIADVRGLSGLTQLRSINLDTIKYTDESLVVLASLGLTRLSLKANNFALSDYALFNAFTTLRVLTLRNISKITEKIAHGCVMTLPNLEELNVTTSSPSTSNIIKDSLFKVVNTKLHRAQIAVRLVATLYLKIDIGEGPYWKKYQKITL